MEKSGQQEQQPGSASQPGCSSSKEEPGDTKTNPIDLTQEFMPMDDNETLNRHLIEMMMAYEEDEKAPLFSRKEAGPPSNRSPKSRTTKEESPTSGFPLKRSPSVRFTSKACSSSAAASTSKASASGAKGHGLPAPTGSAAGRGKLPASTAKRTRHESQDPTSSEMSSESPPRLSTIFEKLGLPGGNSKCCALCEARLTAERCIGYARRVVALERVLWQGTLSDSSSVVEASVSGEESPMSCSESQVSLSSEGDWI